MSNLSDKKHLIIGSLLCLATTVIFIVFGSKLPETVPVHWDSAGNVNGTIEKVYLTFGAPFAYLLINLIGFIKFQNQKGNVWKYYIIPVSAIIISFLVIFLAIL